MSQAANSLYSPYGAYEMKAKYQRNFGFATLCVFGFVAAILLTAWIIASIPEEEYADAPAVVIKTVADLGPPPSVAKRPPQVQVSAPNVAAPKVGIPTPVADDEVLDEDVVLATRDEMAEIVAPDVASMTEGSGDIVVDIDESDYLPAPEDFVAVEVYPVMIHKEVPTYPRFAKEAGITGTVWVKALVDEAGDVIRAIVGKSSGVASLDEAAVEAAYSNKFKPGIQNGRPVKVWVTYEMEFKLNR